MEVYLMKSQVNRRRLIFAVCFVFLLGLLMGTNAPHLAGQSAALAQVSGVVADPSGGAIAGAQVTIKQVDQQLTRTTATDTTGHFTLPNLPVGPYELTATANGFKTYLQSGIVLQVGNSIDVKVTMALGSVSDSVSVTAAAGMVQTQENTISQVVDQARMVDLPLNGREATQLILLAGAANTTPPQDMVSNKTFYSSVTISVAGSQGNGVTYLLDGGSNMYSASRVNLPIPFPDALQEFSVETGASPARYGLNPGGVVNAVTKSGSNQWHGDLFEFLRNGDVNARNFFAPVHDSLKRNQFGGTVGSKIIRDKLFFFGGFQGTYNRSNPPQSVSYVPTQAVLGGDFSTIDGTGCVSGGTAKTILDPLSGQPFPNDQIPVSRFNQQALNLVKYLPAAQTPCGKVTYGIPVTGDEDQIVGRVDWVQSAKHTFYGRYFIDNYRNPDEFNGQDLLTTTVAGNLEQAQSFTLGDTYSLDATTVNLFHATFTRLRNNRGAPVNDINPTTLGVNSPEYFPNLLYATVTGYFAVGCGSCSPAHYDANAFHVADSVDFIRGRHQISIGAEIVRDQLNVLNGQTGNGDFTFNGQYASGKTTGDALAAFMLGTMSDYTQSGVQLYAERATSYGIYVQDSYRVTDHITINAGLRWDPTMAPYDAFGRGDNFYPDAYAAGKTSLVYTNAPAGLLFNGDPGVPRGLENNHLLNLSPRLGIVWDPTGTGKQTIRVSGGILRDREMLSYAGREFGLNPPYGESIDLGIGGNFSNPWAGYAGGSPFPIPSPIPKNVTFPADSQISAMPLNMSPMYTAQWNVSYQRQIKPNWLVSATYMGNKTTHIWTSEDINPGVYIAGSSANINLRRVLYLQNPTVGSFYSNIWMADQNANARYNGLLLSVQHRLSHGVTLLTNYTWSRCISDVDYGYSDGASYYENPYNRAADHGNCNFDVRQHTNTSLIMLSPVQGRAFAQRLLEGWQLSPIVSAQTGLPLNVTDGTDISQTGVGLDRPNLVLTDASLHSSNPLALLNPAAFKTQPPGTFGNLGRDAFTGPSSVNIDLALTRTLHFRERLSLEIRAEAFNVINHPNFIGTVALVGQTSMSLALNSSTFGQIQSANDPRILQFALKLHF
jgi:hypothetical protein